MLEHYFAKIFLVQTIMYINVIYCYILFNCAFSRAVHLEVTSDLTAENLLLAAKRFISRRGKSTKFISDNAKTFKKSNKLKSFLIKKNIK